MEFFSAWRSLRRLLAGAALGVCAFAATAQDVGEVTFVQGAASAQRPGGEARFLAKGDAIAQGEVLNTSERGYAVLSLTDGTKLTLRPNTAFAVNELNQQSGRESLAMSLLRGGLRAFTGLIGKNRPQAMRLTTPTATVGIRGTEFDARLCGDDCRREAPYAKPGPPAAAQNLVVARLVVVNGNATAVATDGTGRALAPGAAVFNGESIRTGPDSNAVLAFRDRTKVTLIEKTDFKLEDVRMAGPSEQGNFLVRLFTGGIRAFTGAIGRANRGNVRFVTPTATVGIRGTGLDLQLRESAVFLYTWDGSSSLTPNDGQELVVEKDSAASLGAGAGAAGLLNGVPQFFLDERAIRPDQLDVDFDNLFAVRRFNEFVPGLYVGVRRGNVNVAGASGLFVDLGPFEAALLPDGSDRPERIEPLPGFLFNDSMPLPDEVVLRPLRLIELAGPGRLSASDQCLLQ